MNISRQTASMQLPPSPRNHQGRGDQHGGSKAVVTGQGHACSQGVQRQTVNSFCFGGGSRQSQGWRGKDGVDSGASGKHHRFSFLSYFHFCQTAKQAAPKPGSVGTNKCPVVFFLKKSMRDQDKFLRKSQSVSQRNGPYKTLVSFSKFILFKPSS